MCFRPYGNERREVMKFRICVLAGVLVLGGCSSDSGEDAPTPDPSQSSNSEPTPDPLEDPDNSLEPAYTVDAEYFGTPIEVSVYPAQREGETLLAQIDLELGQSGQSEPVNLANALSRQSTQAAKGVEDVRLIDRDEGRVYLAAYDAEENVAGTSGRSNLQLEPGDGAVSLDVFFEGTTGNQVDIHLPNIAYPPDVPVVE